MFGTGSRWRLTPRMHLYFLLGYLTILLLTGGGSRDDIQSLLFLRPFTVLACAFALFVAVPGGWRSVRIPLILLLAFMAWHLIQLVPLPPAMWQALPGRELIAQIDASAALGDVWRPITLSPSLTLNSFFSLFAPLGALLLFANISGGDRSWIFVWMCAAALVSAILAILQTGGPSNGPLYLYAITNVGYPNGFFANRNHQSFLLAVSIFTTFWIVGSGRLKWASGYGGKIAAAVIILMMTPLVLATGSRAGLALSVLSYLGGAVVVWRSNAFSQPIPLGRRRSISTRWAAALFFAAVMLLAAGMIVLARDVALSRIAEEGASSETRLAALPILVRIASEMWLTGGGMGSFDRVFFMYEPVSMLGPRYLNEAHNDWLQIVVEGGLPAVALLLLGGAWLIRAAFGILRHRNWLQTVAIPALWVIASLGMASVLDYPLRVPSLAAIFATMVAVVSAVWCDFRSSGTKGAAV